MPTAAASRESGCDQSRFRSRAQSSGLNGLHARNRSGVGVSLASWPTAETSARWRLEEARRCGARRLGHDPAWERSRGSRLASTGTTCPRVRRVMTTGGSGCQLRCGGSRPCGWVVVRDLTSLLVVGVSALPTVSAGPERAGILIPGGLRLQLVLQQARRRSAAQRLSWAIEEQVGWSPTGALSMS